MLVEEQKQILRAIEDAKQLQQELLQRQGGRADSSSAEILHELREERSNDLLRPPSAQA